MRALSLEYTNEQQTTFGPCECCGEMTKRVWGWVSEQSATVAAYFVEWTPGHMDGEANFDLIYGRWGEDTSPADRFAIAALFRNSPISAFMFINATERQVSKSSLVGSALTRDAALQSNLRSTYTELWMPLSKIRAFLRLLAPNSRRLVTRFILPFPLALPSPARPYPAPALSAVVTP